MQPVIVKARRQPSVVEREESAPVSPDDRLSVRKRLQQFVNRVVLAALDTVRRTTRKNRAQQYLRLRLARANLPERRAYLRGSLLGRLARAVVSPDHELHSLRAVSVELAGPEPPQQVLHVVGSEAEVENLELVRDLHIRILPVPLPTVRYRVASKHEIEFALRPHPLKDRVVPTHPPVLAEIGVVRLRAL